MTPDIIDNRISDELFEQRSQLRRIAKEQEWAEKKVGELEKQLGCDHEPEIVDGIRSKCSKCGFVYVR